MSAVFFTLSFVLMWLALDKFLEAKFAHGVYCDVLKEKFEEHDCFSMRVWILTEEEVFTPFTYGVLYASLSLLGLQVTL
jgi:hypothetical protein